MEVMKLARARECCEMDVFIDAYKQYFNVKELSPRMEKKINFDFVQYHHYGTIPYYVKYFLERTGTLKA